MLNDRQLTLNLPLSEDQLDLGTIVSSTDISLYLCFCFGVENTESTVNTAPLFGAHI
jgi:hypothetical protein